MKRTTHRQRVFSSLRDKTLYNQLRQLFVTQFGYQDKVLFAEAMIERILDTIDAFTRPASQLRPGQLMWMAVAHDGRKHAHQTMKEIPQVPVILDLVTDNELQALTDGEDYRLLRRRRHARLLDQAFAQGGVLAQGDLAVLSLLSASTVRTDLADIRKEEHRIPPYRGVVQDVGGSTTHKVEVARLLEQGFLEPEICQRLPIRHTLASVENYAQTYKNVLKLLEHRFAPTEVSGILHIGMRLVNAYIDIVREHHPAVLARNPYTHESTRSHGPNPNQGPSDPN